jgi:hypothetical protein
MADTPPNLHWEADANAVDENLHALRWLHRTEQVAELALCARSCAMRDSVVPGGADRFAKIELYTRRAFGRATALPSGAQDSGQTMSRLCHSTCSCERCPVKSCGQALSVARCGIHRKPT